MSALQTKKWHANAYEGNSFMCESNSERETKFDSEAKSKTEEETQSKRAKKMFVIDDSSAKSLEKQLDANKKPGNS